MFVGKMVLASCIKVSAAPFNQGINKNDCVPIKVLLHSGWLKNGHPFIFHARGSRLHYQ